MADILIDKQAVSLDISDTFDGYSRVVVKTGQTDDEGNEIAYISGNTSGRTLEVTCPWATQAVADNILAKIEGWAYQPLEADGASINPAFEVGDSIVVNNVFSGIYSSKVNFTRLFLADVKAPADKEINHEYQYESSQERIFTRKLNDAVARLNFYADSIEAKVDKVNNGSTFGWRLTDSSWSVFNQQGNIFAINANGAYVKGEIQASSGKIGGFNIGARGLWNNQSSFGGQEQTGVYIGTDGIQLGTKFRVDSQGNLDAASGNFDGNVYAKNIQYGGTSGYFSGSGISAASLGTGQFMQGINLSLGYADFANDVFNNRDIAEYITAKYVNVSRSITADDYYVRIDSETQGTVGRHTHYVTVSGNTVTIGAPDFTGAPHPFNVAGTATVQSTVVNGTPTYRTAYRDYAVPVKVTLSNGATSTTTIYVNASAAYNAGVNSVDVNWSDGDWDIWIDPYYYDAWEEINGGLVHAKLTNGKERTVRLNW